MNEKLYEIQIGISAGVYLLHFESMQHGFPVWVLSIGS